jgi:hypothetical protein
LPDLLAHGGTEQCLADAGMRGQCVGHRHAAEIAGELIKSRRGDRHLLDVNRSDPARYRGRTPSPSAIPLSSAMDCT